MENLWQNIKQEIQRVRSGGSKEELFRLSENYFAKVNQMVATAQEISDHKTYVSMQVFVIYLILTVSVFIFWYKYKQKQIKKALYIDELTGINNFTAFEIELKDKLEYIDKTSALLYLDIDDFKYLNSFYGNKIGDQLLRTLAWTFQSFVEKQGCCGRTGNDQFLLLCEYNEKTIEELKEKIKNNMKESIELDLYNDLSLCIGFYMIKKEENVNDVIDNASLAHKHAKKLGKGTILYYNQELLDQLYYESKLTNQMHKALNDKDFKLYLQPKFEIPSLKVVGAEALVRWHNEDNKVLYPDEFIPVFEQNGFIYELDFYMLEQVCLFIKKHHLEETDFKISVNFSRVTIHHQDFSQNLKAVMKKHHIPVQCIELEITESVFNDVSQHIISMLELLCKEGYIFAMDDFGAGYSSLNSIYTIPVDIIKIDKAFLMESLHNQSVYY